MPTAFGADVGLFEKPFGALSDGRGVRIYTLRNAAGMKVSFMDYGATLLSLYVPDREGNFADVVCGYDNLHAYENADGYQGALIGRCANRVGNASFVLDGKTYALAKNDGENSLHGGWEGFNRKIWQVTAKTPNSSDESGTDKDEETDPSITFSYLSPDGEEGYPGALRVSVTYTLTKNNALSLQYRAQSTKKTVCNLTNHAYFNLGGYASGSILDHILWIDADRFLPTDNTLIPTGDILDVAGTPFDFRSPKAIGKDFFSDDVRLRQAGGYDHCMVFAQSPAPSGALALRAMLTEPRFGRVMRVFTDEPCLQFYTGNFLKNAAYPFRGGFPQSPQHALALETQHMPDSMNHEGFTNVILSPGEQFSSTTVYAFDTDKK